MGDFGARKYDARIGRFTSVDALWSIQPEYTPYHYSANDPINKKDPSGYRLEELGGAVYNIAITLVYGHEDCSPLQALKYAKLSFSFSLGFNNSVGSSPIGIGSAPSGKGGGDGAGPAWNGSMSQFTNISNFTLTHGGPDKKASPAKQETFRENQAVNSTLGNDYFNSRTGEYLGTDKSKDAGVKLIDPDDFARGELSKAWYVFYTYRINETKGINDSRRNVAGKIFDHYANITGIQPNGPINPNYQGFEGVDKENRVYVNPEYFAGQKDYEEYRVLQNKFDVISVMIHVGTHLNQPETTAELKNTHEREAVRAQIHHPSWAFTSTAFKNLFFVNGYINLLSSIEKQTYFHNYGAYGEKRK